MQPPQLRLQALAPVRMPHKFAHLSRSQRLAHNRCFPHFFLFALLDYSLMESRSISSVPSLSLSLSPSFCPHFRSHSRFICALALALVPFALSPSLRLRSHPRSVRALTLTPSALSLSPSLCLHSHPRSVCALTLAPSAPSPSLHLRSHPRSICALTSGVELQ